MVTLVNGQSKDLGGGFMVARLLPAAARRTVGPFVFLDHFGPTVRQPGQNFDVRPHPHIGLATVTYLFDGAMLHRDSVGSVQRIEPGAINWMTAGRGIVHSERTPDDLRDVAQRMHGLQMWVGLPRDLEEVAPSFAHVPADRMPVYQRDGVTVRVLVGSLEGRTSPVVTASPTLFLHVSLPAGARLDLASPAPEVAVYPLDGALLLNDVHVPARTLAVADDGASLSLVHAAAGSGTTEIAILGGAPLDGPRHLAWNFVSHSKERLEQAMLDWQEQRFSGVPGETEFIPLPEYLRPPGR
jgi:redox-sensitive bicupin YhaK (pirin superfamily)